MVWKSPMRQSLAYSHEIVWNFRKHIEPISDWRTPDYLNSLRYAFTECGEAMDAWLRSERPEDGRNNQKDHGLYDELVDIGIMLLTALDFEYLVTEWGGYDVEFIWQHASEPEIHRLETLFAQVADALLSARNDNDEKSSIYLGWIHPTAMALGWIATYPGMDLVGRLKFRLEKIAQKRIPDFWRDNPTAVQFVDDALPWVVEQGWSGGDDVN